MENIADLGEICILIFYLLHQQGFLASITVIEAAAGA
jgi:hypothetical protein